MQIKYNSSQCSYHLTNSTNNDFSCNLFSNLAKCAVKEHFQTER